MTDIIKRFNPLESLSELAIEALPYAGSVRDAVMLSLRSRAHLFLTQLAKADEELDEVHKY